MKKYIVTVNGKKYEVEVEEAGVSETSMAKEVSKAQEVKEEVRKETTAPMVQGGSAAIKAPMPGTILDIKISQGQKVKKGDVLFILEAMKMENEIMAGEDGVIANIVVSKGASVNTDDTLATLQ
jgi:biotin carboxyl carrier protein